MIEQYLFNFQQDISEITMPEGLNNPFETQIPKIGLVAVREVQDFIGQSAAGWGYDFTERKGKMFGVLVVQLPKGGYAYLMTVSGVLGHDQSVPCFVPSVFDDSPDQSFVGEGMRALSALGLEIQSAEDQATIQQLKATRKQKSFLLQQRIFSQYQFLNQKAERKNVLDIFRDFNCSSPPAAAGDCAAPKLLHFAFKHSLKPIAIAEFWWGNTPKGAEKQHGHFYPACQSRCLPILQFMLAVEN
ncbi:pseudouridylate synthase [Persicobacter psychrovividus]|uniref:Pseudouridylate synthase n=1 Tax=Persicobacter psychrovividus TaxID=387638 RepID=A0ABM7VI88_9BACT|nr:hypothetical protein PEPS_29610 [Persicobacter psychrovividus]